MDQVVDSATWRHRQMHSAGAIHQSNKGPPQYTSFPFARRLAVEGLIVSMGTVR